MSTDSTAPAHPLADRGLYVPLDVNFADDPKIIEAGVEAELVYVRSLAIAKRLGTDGRIHRAHLWRLTSDLPSVAHEGHNATLIAEALVDAGLWIEHPAGWEITAWSRWNLTAAEIEERKRGKAEGAALGNHRRWHEARNKVDPDCSYCTRSQDRSDTESLEGSDTESTKTETERGTTSPRTRGCRVPIPFPVDEQMQAQVEREHPGLDWVRETEKFVDHFRATPGAKGVKLDWPATWRNWMRRASEGAFR